jgi:hypothetical protein
MLVAASQQTPSGTAFVVVTRVSSQLPDETIDSLHAAGMLTARAPATWEAAGQGGSGPALVITDRQGVVSKLYPDRFPDATGLIGDLDRASVQ